MSLKTTGEKQGRAAGGRFKPGSSGNPSGRPKGSRNRSSAIVQALIDGDAEAIGQKVVRMALEGDQVAMRLCLERLVSRRERCVSIEVPRVRTIEEVTEAVGVVIESAASGALSLPEAKEFLGLLEQQRKAIETTQLAARLEAIEAELGREREAEPGAEPEDLGARLAAIERMRREGDE